jgi:hypothetical protein
MELEDVGTCGGDMNQSFSHPSGGTSHPSVEHFGEGQEQVLGRELREVELRGQTPLSN